MRQYCSSSEFDVPMLILRYAAATSSSRQRNSRGQCINMAVLLQRYSTTEYVAPEISEPGNVSWFGCIPGVWIVPSFQCNTRRVCTQQLHPKNMGQLCQKSRSRPRLE